MQQLDNFIKSLFSKGRRSPQRIGVIGDVHCEDWALETAIKFLQAQDTDIVLCVGDLADGNGDLNKCCEILQRHQIPTVSGNHDRWLLSEQARSLPEATLLKTVSTEAQQFLRVCPSTLDLQTSYGLMQLCHGLSENDMASVGIDDFGYALECNEELQGYLYGGHYQLVICGHTHRRMVRHFKQLTIINAGTIKQEHDPCCTIIDLENYRVLFHNFENECKITTTPASSINLRESF